MIELLVSLPPRKLLLLLCIGLALEEEEEEIPRPVWDIGGGTHTGLQGGREDTGTPPLLALPPEVEPVA